MLVPIKWLNEYVNIDVDINEFAEIMTMSGSNVESVNDIGQDIDKVVVGKIIEILEHPGADKLVITNVDVGNEVVQIVTGATNINEGDYVPVALNGAILPNGVKIKKGRLRGVESNGMLCSADELSLDEDSLGGDVDMVDGIYILEEKHPLGIDIKSVLGLDDKIIEFEITTNRPDCNSIIGIAREAAAVLGKKVTYPKIKKPGKSKEVGKYISIEVKNPALCPRFAGRVVKNIRIEPSPLWMQERLVKAGIRPVNNIVDITNYVMVELGQPMHAYDLKKLEGNKIIVRNAEKNEKIITLDESERLLMETDLVIADSKKAIGIAGIMGGYNSEIEDDTKDIVFECANFDAVNVRLSSKRLGFRTDASSRYEKGLDTELITRAINRACYLVEELKAGEVVDGIIDIYPEPKEERVVTLRPERVKWLLGVDVEVNDIKRYLEALEFQVSGEKVIEAVVPSYRDDVTLEEDLIEEIARLYGYENIPSKLMDTTFTQGGKSQDQNIVNMAKENLLAQGLYEVLTYTFVSPSVFNQINLKADNPLRNAIKLLNPLGEEQSIMRTTIIPCMLDLIFNNYNKKIDEGWFFEISKVYIADELPLKDLPYEKRVLTIGMYGDIDFYDLKGVIENLLLELNVRKYRFLPSCHDSLHPGKTAELLINNKRVGCIGEVHPYVLDNYGIPVKVYTAELNFDEIIKQTDLDRKYETLPRYPSVERDIAIVVSEEISAGQIEEIIRNKGGKLIEEVNLFDIYKGSQIEEGYKSMAYSIVYRSGEKTLTDKDVLKVHKKILSSLENQVGAALRS